MLNQVASFNIMAQKQSNQPSPKQNIQHIFNLKTITAFSNQKNRTKNEAQSTTKKKKKTQHPEQ